jgi:hypothetical protein
MKKMLIVCSLAFVVDSTYSNAQSNLPGPDQVHSWAWNAMTPGGAQSVPVPGGKGVLKFNKQGDDFINTLFIDAGGKTSWLIPAEPGTYTPGYSIRFSMLEPACFASSDKTIGLCICKTEDSTSGTNNYVIGISKSDATATLK